MTEISRACRDVIAERVIQIVVEGWTPEHDDAEHASGELAMAAGCYAMAAGGTDDRWTAQFWPFARRWWKRAEPRRMLVVAAALIIAEIERLDRASGTPTEGIPHPDTSGPGGPKSEGADTFMALRRANIDRQIEWCADQLPDLSFRGNELAGEGGEVITEALSLLDRCGRLLAAIGRSNNIIKKLERERLGWRGSRSSVKKLGDELADVVICADLCAITAGIDLRSAVIEKFNETSENNGLKTILFTAPSYVAEGARV